MNDHVDEFKSVLQKIKFLCAETISKKDIDIAFLIFLRGSDTQKNCHNANPHRAINIRTVDLIAGAIMNTVKDLKKGVTLLKIDSSSTIIAKNVFISLKIMLSASG